MNSSALWGMVFSKYKNINAFAKTIGWHRSRAGRIINGIQEPNLNEITEIVLLLDISLEDFLNIFFEGQYTKCKNEAS